MKAFIGSVLTIKHDEESAINTYTAYIIFLHGQNKERGYR